MSDTSVVLPAPFGPSSATTSPGAMRTETASSARTAPKRFDARSTTTTLSIERASSNRRQRWPLACFEALRERPAAVEVGAKRRRTAVDEVARAGHEADLV